MSHIVLQFFNTLEWRGSCYDWSGIYFSKLPGFSSSTLDPLYQNNKCFDDKIRFVFFLVFSHLQKKLAILFIDITSLCLFHSAFMGANNVLGGSFALLIDGQMVYKQVPLLFPVFLSFDAMPRSMFLNPFLVTTHLNVNEQILEPSSGLRSGWSRKSIPQVCLKSLCIMEWKQKQ